MDRQNRMLTVLATVLLILVAIVVYGRQEEDRKPDTGDPPERELFKLESGDVTGLTLESAGSSVSFTKKDGTWTMTAPAERAVEERRVTEIVDRFADLEVREEPVGDKLADFGLDDAGRVTVTLTTSDNRTLVALVGRDTPVGYKTYVAEAAAGPALLASSRLGDLVHRSADDFRSRDVWSIRSASTKRVRIEQGGTSVVLRKDDHGWWLGDDGHRASTTEVEDWLSKASGLRVDSFLDGAALATVGLSPAQATITLEDEGGTHTLLVGQRDDTGVVLQGDGGPVRSASTAVDLLELAGWVDTALLPVRRDQVDRIEITLGDKVARYTKADDAWKDASGAESTAVEHLFDVLNDATADRTSPSPAIGSTWGTITLAEGTTRTETVTIGATLPEGGQIGRAHV